MLDPFDIFKWNRTEPSAGWRATSDFERAKSYVNRVLAVAIPADYLILNQRTGSGPLSKPQPNAGTIS